MRNGIAGRISLAGNIAIVVVAIALGCGLGLGLGLGLGPGFGFGPVAVEAFSFNANEPPVAAFTYSPSPALAGESVTFDAGESYDPDGTIAGYEWDFTGDGVADASGKTAVWAFDKPGMYAVTLVVIDNENTVGRVTRHVQVGSLGVGELEAKFTYAPERPRPGQLVTFDATETATPGGGFGTVSGTAAGPGQLKYEWDLTGDGRFDTFGAIARRTFNKEGAHKVTLRVTDDYGRVAEVTRSIQVGKGSARVVIESEPSELSVVIDGSHRGYTPLTLDLEPERYQVRVKHPWRGEWDTELDLRYIDEVTLRIVLR